ncbi:MAG: hypothetical protein ACI4QU_00365 [Christensenellales bacterium]
MYKTIIAVIVLALIITGGILDNANVNKVFDEFDARLNDLRTLVEEENKPDSIKLLKETDEWWSVQKSKMEFYSYSQDLRLISSCLGETLGSLECDDFENALSKVESLLSISANTRNLLGVRIENIV